MKITKEIKKTAAELFATTVTEDKLYVNSKGNFFTNKNRAELSDKPKNLSVISRGEVAELIENAAAAKKEAEAKKKADAKAKADAEAKAKKEAEDKAIAEADQKRKDKAAAQAKADAEAKEKAKAEAEAEAEQTKKEIAELKAMGDKLPEHLGSLKQNVLKSQADILGIKYPAVIKNSVLVEKILKAITKA